MSPAPWVQDADGIVTAADGKVVCVVGDPSEGLDETDLANGRLITAAPGLVAELSALAAWLEERAGSIEATTKWDERSIPAPFRRAVAKSLRDRASLLWQRVYALRGEAA